MQVKSVEMELDRLQGNLTKLMEERKNNEESYTQMKQMQEKLLKKLTDLKRHHLSVEVLDQEVPEEVLLESIEPTFYQEWKVLNETSRKHLIRAMIGLGGYLVSASLQIPKVSQWITINFLNQMDAKIFSNSFLFVMGLTAIITFRELGKTDQLEKDIKDLKEIQKRYPQLNIKKRKREI